MSEDKDPQLYPEETVDRLESDALGGTGNGHRGTDAGRRAKPDGELDTDRSPIHDQDKDVEDLPGGGGDQGGSTSEPSG